MKLYASHTALRRGGYKAYPNRDIMMFEKMNGGKRYLIVVNVRDRVCTATVPTGWRGHVTDLYQGQNITLSSQLILRPYEYRIIATR